MFVTGIVATNAGIGSAIDTGVVAVRRVLATIVVATVTTALTPEGVAIGVVAKKLFDAKNIGRCSCWKC